jgi:hypothetical protein
VSSEHKVAEKCIQQKENKPSRSEKSLEWIRFNKCDIKKKSPLIDLKCFDFVRKTEQLTELKNLGFELITSNLCDGGETEPAVRMAEGGRPHRHRRRLSARATRLDLVGDLGSSTRQWAEGKQVKWGKQVKQGKESVFYVRTWVPAITICLVVVRISNDTVYSRNLYYIYKVGGTSPTHISLFITVLRTVPVLMNSTNPLSTVPDFMNSTRPLCTVPGSHK